ncbi:hypothetical protein JCM14469_13420 [Desulfatiferula olefinivorans]
MANPPFNMKAGRASDELTDDPRWDGYEIPPTGNTNYAWILHMASKLSTNGVAGFVLANGSMSTNTTSEGAIRKKLVANDLVNCMIALPGQIFFTTQIPVCLWFITRNKKADTECGDRNREGETLFIDARKMGSMINCTQKGLLPQGIADIAKTYHAWRSAGVPPACRAQETEGMKGNATVDLKAGGTPALPPYTDIPGYCDSASRTLRNSPRRHSHHDVHQASYPTP